MDFRLIKLGLSRLGLKKLGGLRIVTPQEGLREVARRAPQAEAIAERWAERAMPTWKRIYAMRRRVATVAVGTAAVLLFVHVVFGANGMVVYQQKHAEVQELRNKTEKIRQENEALTQENADLGSDSSKAVEREAREHLHYARPGEVVYVPGEKPRSGSMDTSSARK